jgi:cysteine-rich repeat protein
MRSRAVVWTLLFGLTAATPAVATVADDLCAPADDPCVIDQRVEVAPASLLDFGVRALEVRRGGVLDVGDGNLTITARSVRVFAGGAVLARGGDTPRIVAITTSGALSVDGTAVARGRIDVSGPTAGEIRLTAGGSFTLGGELNARGVGEDASGGVITVTGLVVAVGPSARVIAAGGADEAGGEVVLAAPGQTMALGGLVDVSGGSGDGGTIALDAGPTEVTATLDARSRIGEGDGGVVEIVSTGTVFLRGPVIASSDCPIDETCFSTGGEVTIDTAEGAVIVDAPITLTGEGIDGSGGILTVEAASDVVQRARVLVNGRGSAGCGGEVAVTAGRNITLGPIDASGRDCDGGFVSAIVDGLGRVTAAGEIDADGQTGGGGGSIEFEGEDVVVAASVHASSGTGLGGTVTIDACGSIEVTADADVTTRGDRGENLLAAARGMTIDGSLRAGVGDTGAGGSNELRFRSQASPPVIASTAVVVPAATLVLDPTLSTCSTPLPAECGNEVLDDGEACDDGNTDPCDGCSATCALEGCGNQQVETACGEQCDDGNATACDGCSPSCTTEGCGNGVAECTEACDDGSANGTIGSSCDVACALLPPPGCGQDGVGPGETCDDGNATACDSCSPICQVEACGNDVLECGEVCDDGNQDACDGCSAACTVERCGDGVVGCEEDCDEGDANGAPGSTCDTTCHEGTICGLVTNESPCIPCAGDTDCDPVGRCGGKACSDGVCVAVAVPSCDDQHVGTIDRCVLDGTGAPVCQHECTGDQVCDDGDRCTADSCAGVDGCVNAPLSGVAGVTCRVAGIDDVLASRPDEVRPKLARQLTKRLEKLSERLAAAAAADAAGKTRRERKILGKVVGGLRQFERLVKRAQRKNKISPELAHFLLEASGAASSAAVALRSGLQI